MSTSTESSMSSIATKSAINFRTLTYMDKPLDGVVVETGTGEQLVVGVLQEVKATSAKVKLRDSDEVVTLKQFKERGGAKSSTSYGNAVRIAGTDITLRQLFDNEDNRVGEFGIELRKWLTARDLTSLDKIRGSELEMDPVVLPDGTTRRIVFRALPPEGLDARAVVEHGLKSSFLTEFKDPADLIHAALNHVRTDSHKPMDKGDEA